MNTHTRTCCWPTFACAWVAEVVFFVHFPCVVTYSTFWVKRMQRWVFSTAEKEMAGNADNNARRLASSSNSLASIQSTTSWGIESLIIRRLAVLFEKGGKVLNPLACSLMFVDRRRIWSSNRYGHFCLFSPTTDKAFH